MHTGRGHGRIELRLILILCAIGCVPADPLWAQRDMYSWNVWECTSQLTPNPGTFGPDSRNEWITVAQYEPGIGSLIVHCHIYPGSHAWPTFAEAAFEADMLKLQPPDTDRFRSVCNRSWSVWRNPNTGVMITFRDINPQPLGFTIFRANICCEDALNLIGSSPVAGDCRTFQLVSVPGAVVAYTGGSFVSLTGAPITIPSQPPFVIPTGSVTQPTTGTNLSGNWKTHTGSVIQLTQLEGSELERALTGDRVTGSAVEAAPGRPGATLTLAGTFNGTTLAASFTTSEGTSTVSGTLNLALTGNGTKLEGQFFANGQSTPVTWIKSAGSITP